jgi:hypothetical protein
MEYAARLPRTSSRKAIVAPLVALVVGAGAATGAYALIDNSNTATLPANVIVVEKPGPHAAEIPGKNEAATAAAISPQTGALGRGHDESTTAAAISTGDGIVLRGSKASSTGTSSQAAAKSQPTESHPLNRR